MIYLVFFLNFDVSNMCICGNDEGKNNRTNHLNDYSDKFHEIFKLQTK